MPEDEKPKGGGDEGEESHDTPAPQPKPAPVQKTAGRTVTDEDFDAEVERRVAAKRAEEAEKIRAQEAEAQGNYQQLYEDAKKQAEHANLALWRTRALSKHGLADTFFDALVGTTEEEIMASAKKLAKTISDEVAARLEAEKERNTPPAPPAGGRSTPPRGKALSTKEATRAVLKTTLGLGEIRH